MRGGEVVPCLCPQAAPPGPSAEARAHRGFRLINVKFGKASLIIAESEALGQCWTNHSMCWSPLETSYTLQSAESERAQLFSDLKKKKDRRDYAPSLLVVSLLLLLLLLG